MDRQTKMDLVRKAYNNAQKYLKDVRENPPPMCGDVGDHINMAHEIVDEYEWLIDDKKELPDKIFEFLE